MQARQDVKGLFPRLNKVLPGSSIRNSSVAVSEYLCFYGDTWGRLKSSSGLVLAAMMMIMVMATDSPPKTRQDSTPHRKCDKYDEIIIVSRVCVYKYHSILNLTSTRTEVAAKNKRYISLPNSR